jgi:hypothetical protein
MNLGELEMIPNQRKYSSLLRGFMGDIVFMNNLKGKLEYRAVIKRRHYLIWLVDWILFNLLSILDINVLKKSYPSRHLLEHGPFQKSMAIFIC